MPVAIPVIAGAIAGYASAAVGFTIAGSFLLGSMVVGAVVGGIVGGIQSAVEGGDILEGVLYGAVGGAAGGAIGGAIESFAFGVGGGEAGVTGLSDYAGVTTAPSVAAEKKAAADAAALAKFEGTTVAKEGIGATELMLTQGGIAGLSGLMSEDPELPYSQTEAGQKAELESRERIAKLQAESAGAGSGASVAAASIAAQQRREEALLQAQLTREKMARDATEFEKTLAQRNIELERPIQEQYASLARQRETASGLTIARKMAERANANNNLISTAPA